MTDATDRPALAGGERAEGTMGAPTIDLGDGYSLSMLDFSVKHRCGHVVDYPSDAFDAMAAGCGEDGWVEPADEPCAACKATELLPARDLGLAVERREGVGT